MSPQPRGRGANMTPYIPTILKTSLDGYPSFPCPVSKYSCSVDNLPLAGLWYSTGRDVLPSRHDLMPTDLLPQLNGTRYYDPDKWGVRHRICVALHMGGDRNKEIAERLGCSESWVSKTLGDARAVYEIAQLEKNLADRTMDTALRFKLYANEALDEIMEELRSCSDVRVRQKAAFGILDRAGYTPHSVDQGDAPPLLPAEVIDRMEQTTKELVQHRGVYQEVTPTEIDPEGDPILPGSEDA